MCSLDLVGFFSESLGWSLKNGFRTADRKPVRFPIVGSLLFHCHLVFSTPAGDHILLLHFHPGRAAAASRPQLLPPLQDAAVPEHAGLPR
jgi:hypothetical protein